MKSNIPLIGALSLHLRAITLGHPLTAVGDPLPEETIGGLPGPPR
jgi:hypothetical protein